MTTLAVTSVSSLLCQVSTCFRIGSKFRCMRSTPTEMQSMSENDFECLASTGVNAPETMSPSPAGDELESRTEIGAVQPFKLSAESGNCAELQAFCISLATGKEDLLTRQLQGRINPRQTRWADLSFRTL